MQNLPIINELKKFKNENYIKFFMPGHSQLEYKKDYTDTQKKVFAILKDFEKEIFSFDITEVLNFDNLSNPNGIIKDSQDILSQNIGAKKAYFLVNGATVGVLSMISAIANSGEKLIIQKNSHKSVHNACKLNNINEIYISSSKNDNYDIYNKIDIDELKTLVEKNKDAKAIVITSPDYFGQEQDIRKISQIAKENNMYLLVDSAHGANYIYGHKAHSFALNLGADMVVASFHKTLPTLNQTAVLFLGRDVEYEKHKEVQDKINIFQTTSPSYVLLANIEITNYIMSKYGKVLYEDLKENIDYFKSKISDLKFIKILENDDFSRLVIKFKNIDIQNVYEYLKNEYKILPEMVNKKSIVLIANIFHTKTDFYNLYIAIKSIQKKINTFYFKKTEDIFRKNEIKDNSNLRKREKKEKILNYLKDNLGNKSQYTIYIYPPGTPMVMEGDIIQLKDINYMESIIKNDAIDLIF